MEKEDTNAPTLTAKLRTWPGFAPPPYEKIITVWERDPATRKRTLIEGQYATEEFAALCEADWEWTEKIDGTNIRVHWDSEAVWYGGRTDNAEIPPFLRDHLIATFTADAFRLGDLGPMTIYGEGYGAKIQKRGASYIPDGVDFIAFDVRCGGVWLRRVNVLDVAGKLGIRVVPTIGAGPLPAAIRLVRSGLLSEIAQEARTPAEGLVMRAPCGLLDRRGARIMAKVKAKDFVAP